MADRRWFRRVAAVALVVTVGLAVGGCSRIVRGQGVARGLPISSAPATGSDALQCPVGSLHPQGAPFCYPLPPGFSDFSYLNNYKGLWTYGTLVSIGQHDLITVLAANMGESTEAMTARERMGWFTGQRMVVGQYGVTAATPLTPTQVDGAPAMAQDVTYKNGVDSHIVTVERGRTLVNIHCESLERPGAVQSACSNLLSSIQIVSL